VAMHLGDVWHLRDSRAVQVHTVPGGGLQKCDAALVGPRLGAAAIRG
jgi:hypothetical protein